MTTPATKEDLAALGAEIHAKLDAILAAVKPSPDPHQVVDCAEAMRMTNAGSPRALYRLLAKIGVRRVAHGRYRRGDIENAIARASSVPRKR